MNLTIPENIAELTHINIRTEKHGEEDVTACDLSISVVLPNEVLDQLFISEAAPYKSAFWDAEGRVSEPTISGIKLSHNFKGHTFKISVGIEDAKASDDVAIKGLSWTPENGRTLKLKFKVGIRCDEEDIAHFATGLNKHVQIAVIPPAQMDIEDAKPAEEKPTKRRKAAA